MKNVSSDSWVIKTMKWTPKRNRRKMHTYGLEIKLIWNPMSLSILRKHDHLLCKKTLTLSVRGRKLPPWLRIIECVGWRHHSSLIFLILLFTKPNIEVSGWLYQTKTHITHIVYQPFSRVSPPSFTLYDPTLLHP